jgi:predicted enzyme related to lactoylglutathione lyase
MSSTVSISVDVPSIEEGVRFYCSAFGFTKKEQPLPGVAVLTGMNLELCVLEKPAGSRPSPNTNDVRRYERHWTPVHIDLHVDDLRQALERVERAGGQREQLFEDPEHGSAAFCRDPFGHGFCLLQRKPARKAAT